MSNVGRKDRSFEFITDDDLRRLSAIADIDRRDFFARHPDWGILYSDRVIATALCQGAALHFVNRTAGINDFDVYSFFRSHPKRPWYAKRNVARDLGCDKFGQSVDRPDFVGRRVDLLGRGIDAGRGEDPAESIRRWLREGRTCSAKLLAQKAVVLLEPAARRGEVVWPKD